MYQFKLITEFQLLEPETEPVIVTFDPDIQWGSVGEATYSGDPDSVKWVKFYLDAFGRTPYSQAAQSRFLAPMTLYHNFIGHDDVEVELLQGKVMTYTSRGDIREPEEG
ncbi:hypothetical protein ACWJJH_02570 [Endozoicomonadaceae bacterium StTr2]